ncbi:MAG TPA: flagellar biosynthetic protein FliO [Steroidobacteraceae bacterium]|nr:flagellar biosynthetic protein FliO [Steroidobacteraceae bacterium]HRX89326.1 flagellar biosynthetic protein FliO [Steroidobacteraceae bacterium]
MFSARSTLVSLAGLTATAAASRAYTAERKFAAPAADDVVSSAAGGLLEVTISLAIVLAAIFAIAWFARRARSFGSRTRRQIEVLDDLPLGVKERAVLVRVAGKTLLLGVAPGQVRALHAFGPEDAASLSVEPDSSAVSDPASRTPSFAALLRRSMGR